MPKILGVQAEICSHHGQPLVKAGALTLENPLSPELVPSDFVRVLRTRCLRDSFPS